MSVPATFKYDLSNGAVTPVQEGRTAVAYPFLPNGSIGPKVYTRRLLQQEAYYVPATMGLERDSVWAGGDPQAYLIAETSPEHTGIGDMLRFSRSYARIPATQTVYGSRSIVRPVMHDIFSGSSYAVSFDAGATSHRFTSRISVSTVGAITTARETVSVSARSPTALASCTFDVTGPTAGTSNFNNTSSASAIATAFTDRGLTNVNVLKSSYEITISWTGAATVNPTSGTPLVTGGSGSCNITSPEREAAASDTIVVATATRILTTGSAHSGSAGGWMAAWNGDKLVGIVKPTAASGSSVTIPAEESPWNTAGLAITHLAFAANAANRYVNGPVHASIKEVTDFYLPGVSSGITTAADIALVTPKLDPVSWLGEIVAATAFVVIEGSQLQRWLDGPIYSQTTISAQMSDALDTVAVGA